MVRRILKEYKASDWKISKLDPSTSGKYIFDGMEFDQDSVEHCDNCGHPIKWLVYIHDMEDASKQYVVGDDCIDFLLALTDGLENPLDLEKFRQAKKELLKLFNRLRRYDLDFKTMNKFVAVADSASSQVIDFYKIYDERDGFPYKDGFINKIGLIAKLSYPGMNVEDWLHFFPKLKKVLLVCDDDRFCSERGVISNFTDINKRLYGKIKEVPIRPEVKRLGGFEAFDFNADEVAPELELGMVKVLRAYQIIRGYYSRSLGFHGMNVLLSNGSEYNLRDIANGYVGTYGKEFNGKVLVFSEKLKPMFPECQIDLSKFRRGFEEPNPKELVPRFCTDGAPVKKNIEETEEKQRREDERKRREEEARAAEEERRRKEAEAAAAEETRKLGKRGEYFGAMASDSQGVVDGMKNQCIAASWLERVGDKLKELIGQKITGAYGAETGAAGITSSTPLKFTINNCTTNFRLAFKPQVDRLKAMGEGARIGYLTNIIAKNYREHGGKPTTWATTLANGASVTYSFKPTGMKDAGTDAVIVIGKVDVEIVPVISESMKTMNESTKVTLTIKQLKQLVKESKARKSKDDYSIRLNVALDLMLDDQVEEWDAECENEGATSDYDKLSIALDVLSDSQVEEYVRITGDN